MIAILDFGSQYTQLIAKRFRRLGFKARVYPARTSAADLIAGLATLVSPNGPEGERLSGLVLSGSPSSVGTGIDPDPKLLDLGVPVLGICYGYHFLAKHLGGRVESSTHREYGQAWVEKKNFPGQNAGEADPLLAGTSDKFRVWMSHGDSVVQTPPGSDTILYSGDKIAAFRLLKLRMWALQFHPEVFHSQYGDEILGNFAEKICGVPKGEWSVARALENSLAGLKKNLGNVPVLHCAVSGGVDSTVLAVLLSQVTKVHAIFVDHGFLRAYDEMDLRKFFAPYPNIQLEVIDARAAFWKELKGKSDPEEKRKIIGRLFIETFYAHIGAQAGTKVYLGQGTIYSDVIESAKASEGGAAHNIKSHHNVGGLPDQHDFVLVEPLREFFKDEVREIGKLLGIDPVSLARHPCPGPGLSIRCIGDLQPERIEVLKNADALFVSELRKRGLYEKTWQAFCVLLPVASVGVMGDARSYESVLALRAVDSTDAMTAEASKLPLEDLLEIATLIVNQIKGVSRVVYDITGKPPSTIEWE
ncbi:MAG: glutamine-hydrolyzing GMP synthase [Bdellovibrionota bacterium]